LFIHAEALSGDVFRFAVLCDGRGKVKTNRCTDENSGVSSIVPVVLKDILAKHDTTPIRLVLFPGDMISGLFKRDAPSVAECNRIMLRHWRSVVQPLLDAGMVIRITAGDHEARILTEKELSATCSKHYPPYVTSLENFQVLTAVLRDMIGGDNGPASDLGLTYSFDMDGCHFAFLTAYTLFRHHSFSNEVLKWLDMDLGRARKSGLKCFVAAHPPAFPGSKHMWDSLPFYDPSYACDDYDGRYGIDRRRHRDRFWNILKKHNVIAYFCGHEHNIQVQRVEGVWHVLSGGLTERLYPLNDPGLPGETNLILYDGKAQNPRASLAWPWDESKKPFWGWCLVSVEDDRVIMEVYGTDTRPTSGTDLKKLKAFTLWHK
jgi:hypothetical protein